MTIQEFEAWIKGKALINAAPDLLDLAIEVAKEYEDSADWKDAIAKLQGMARAAIAKAEGGK